MADERNPIRNMCFNYLIDRITEAKNKGVRIETSAFVMADGLEHSFYELTVGNGNPLKEDLIAITSDKIMAHAVLASAYNIKKQEVTRILAYLERSKLIQTSSEKPERIIPQGELELKIKAYKEGK
jgi:hypothetical protein